MTSAEEAVRAASNTMSSIDMCQLMARAELQTRTDRKYVVPADTFRAFAHGLRADFDVLDIGGRRLFGYESVYFDSPQLASYRAHLQQRRKRFKIRTRTYLDSGECMLEVKLKGRRSATVKRRMPYSVADRGRLTTEARGFVADLLESAYGLHPPKGLAAVLTTEYRRATFVSRTGVARLTCDVGLVVRDGTDDVSALENHVLVESKSVGAVSRADRLLRGLGVRPATVSKYCFAVAALHPNLPSNPWHPAMRRYFGWCPTTARAVGSTESSQTSR